MYRLSRLWIAATHHRKSLLCLYVIGVFLASGVILYSFVPELSKTTAISLVFFSLLSLSGDLLPISLPKGGAISVGFATKYATILACGPGVASWVAVVGAIVYGLKAKRHIEKFIFNVGQIVVSVGTAGFVFKLLGGNPGLLVPVRNLSSLVGCAVAYFLTNSTLVTVAITLERGYPFWSIWFMNVKWSFPSYLALAPIGFLMAVAYLTIGIPGTMLFLVPLLLARYSFQQYMMMRQVYSGTVRALAAALEAKDEYTRGHSDRVARYAMAIAREMRLSENDMERIEYAAVLHDIGKIGVGDDLLVKIGDLTEEEFNRIKAHPVVGSNILREVEFLREVSRYICSHHERFNGGGYPVGLQGREIPLAARIIAVADAYDAMTSERPYREAFPPKEAAKRIVASAGKQFDPDVVKAFLAVLMREGMDVDDFIARLRAMRR